MFTNEGRTIIDAVKDFLFEALGTVIFTGLGIMFGILIISVREETILLALSYILIVISSGIGAVIIRDEFESMMHTIDRAKEEMKAKEETI